MTINYYMKVVPALCSCLELFLTAGFIFSRILFLTSLLFTVKFYLHERPFNPALICLFIYCFNNANIKTGHLFQML